jgi:replication fork protection complex subunit Tof1/Swi1
LLKDIRSERPKITEKDNLRLLFVTKWFLEYFLAVRAQEKGGSGSEPWAFGLVGEVIERSWIVWVLKRMNGAVEEKVEGLLLSASFYRLTYSACRVHSLSYGLNCRRVSSA